jgi:pilus assembly protein CpaB
MRAGTAIALFIALVLGGSAAYLSRQYLQDFTKPQTSTRTLVVASQPLSFGSQLNDDNLREISWPGERLEGSFATKAQLLKEGRRVALTSFQKNEPILVSKVTGPNQRATLSTLLEEGMRAVTVRVDEVRGVAGFVLPNDRVDVVLTRGEDGGGNSSDKITDILLQNVKVLAVNQLASEKQEKPTVARAVTLALNTQQAQKVILAQNVGRLSLILRQAGDGSPEATRRVTLADLGLTEAVEANPEDDRLAKLEAQLVEMRKSAAAATDAAREAALKRVAELEARLLEEANKVVPAAPAPAPIQPVVAKRDDRVIVNVIRGVTKRDEYTVLSEKP